MNTTAAASAITNLRPKARTSDRRRRGTGQQPVFGAAPGRTKPGLVPVGVLVAVPPAGAPVVGAVVGVVVAVPAVAGRCTPTKSVPSATTTSAPLIDESSTSFACG